MSIISDLNKEIEDNISIYASLLIRCKSQSDSTYTQDHIIDAARNHMYQIIRYSMETYLDELRENLPIEYSESILEDRLFHTVNDDESFINALDELSVSLKALADDDANYCDDQCSPSSDDSEYSDYSEDECTCCSLCLCALFDFESSDSEFDADLD